MYLNTAVPDLGWAATDIQLHHWEVDPDNAWHLRVAGKRMFDIMVATMLSIVMLPLLVVLAATSAVVLRESPFFIQNRVGHAGKIIPFIKIRTLPSANFDPYELHADAKPLEVPEIMRLFRRLHLDEIPQLWLVISGHLSLVGPRPKMPDAVEPVAQEYNEARLSVPQGCTCLWQIGPDTQGTPGQTPHYDYWYLMHGGLRLDLWILLWTGLGMFGLGEPKSIEDAPTWARSRGWVNLDVRSSSISGVSISSATGSMAAAGDVARQLPIAG